MTDRSFELDADTAIVLFELLHRWEDDDVDLDLLPGEQTAIWILSGVLEKTLVEPFDPRWGDIVATARERLLTHGGA